MIFLPIHFLLQTSHFKKSKKPHIPFQNRYLSFSMIALFLSFEYTK